MIYCHRYAGYLTFLQSTYITRDKACMAGGNVSSTLFLNRLRDRAGFRDMQLLYHVMDD